MKKTPFPLAYLDWCKEVKKVTKLEDTERRDWITEYAKSGLYKGEITGFDLMIAMGGKV